MNYLGRFNTFNEAYHPIVDKIMQYGFKATPRGHECVELRPASFCIVDPRRAVYTGKSRRLNYKFLAAEAMSYLAGWGDQRHAQLMIAVNSNMKSFLNPDTKMFDGAYGPRLFQSLASIHKLLQKDESSRQAVASIWSPGIPENSFDVPCLAGDTTVKSPEGDITIAELAQRFKNGLTHYPVYSFDAETRNVELTWCVQAWRSGHRELLEITFDDGSQIKVTPEHQIYRKIRTYTTFVDVCEARSLRPGDRIWAVPFRETGRRHRPCFVGNLSEGWSWKNKKPVHIEYAKLLTGGDIPDGYDVHHKNGDVYDNRAGNLEILSHAEHSALKMFGSDNPMTRETPEAKTQRVRRLHETYYNKKYGIREPQEANHIIVDIRPIPAEDVYDFFVPPYSNAVVGTGVIVHNCTLSLHFYTQLVPYRPRPMLGMTATMRSNDANWGLPYDVASFCILQCAVADALNWEVGTYTHVAGSLHVYTATPPQVLSERYEEWVDPLHYDMTIPVSDGGKGYMSALIASADEWCEELYTRLIKLERDAKGFHSRRGEKHPYWAFWDKLVRFTWRETEEAAK